MAQMHVYVGTYTSNGGEGIYLYSLDTGTGALRLLKIMAGVVNPSFLAIEPGGRYLYSVNEVDAYYGRPEGALSAFAIEPGTGELRFLNQQPSQGASPCHLSLDHTGRYLFVANYGGGSVAAFPLQSDGSLASAASHIRHQGSGPNRERQEGPHAHCILPDPFNRHVLAVDLGLDRVLSYAFDPERGALRPAAAAGAETKPGSGPRHMAFHPNGKWAYVVHELESRVSRFLYNGMTGALAELESLPSLPPQAAVEGENYGAGIQVDPKGRFLYVSNRGHDSIAHFRIDPENGSLGFAGCASTKGRFPRHFSLDPGGRFLLAANQRSDSLTVFRVDDATGNLEDTDQAVSVPAPVCVLVHAPLQR
ncbi:MAG: 6-phosphogluconolactonase [Fibrobacteres bacterium]|nr:6-phosphogluconolactonase [Fibrobacterota bacterium]